MDAAFDIVAVGDKTEDRLILDRDVGHANMVAELVLTRKAMEEPIEIRVAAREPVPIVVGCQPPNRKAHKGSL